MTTPASGIPLRHLPADVLRRLRGALEDADYTEETALARLELTDLFQIHSTPEGILARRTRAGSPCETWIRLFLCGLPVSEGDLRRGSVGVPLPRWIDAGLLRADGADFRAEVRLTPHKRRFFAHDRGGYAEADLVMGFAPASRSLLRATIRGPFGRTLDLGTGCGAQAIFAEEYSNSVVGVDCNPRALRFARWNAAFNEAPGIEWREGDLFAPVSDLRFDLIVTNPPFVISPTRRFLYRDGGAAGGGVVRAIVEGARDRLNEGGYLQMLCQWPHLRGQDGRAVLASWLAGCGCDALVLEAATESALDYIAGWRQADDGSFEEWADFFEQEGIEAVTLGNLTLRRRSGAGGWLCHEKAPPYLGPIGDAIRTRFERQDFLEAHTGDAALLTAELRVSPDARLMEETTPGQGERGGSTHKIRLEHGLGYTADLAPSAAELLRRIGPGQILAAAIAALPSQEGESPESHARCLLSTVRTLLTHGFLEPVTR